MDFNGSNILLFIRDTHGEDKILEILTSRDFDVVAVNSLPELLKALSNREFDLAVFGMAPGQDNITDLSMTIRSICRVPVLFVLPPDSGSHQLHQAKSCADDFIIWPVREEELILRSEMVISCNSKREGSRSRDRYSIGEMSFDFKNQLLHTPGGSKNLTRIEAHLLHLLCLYRNSILPREIALETIWGENDYFKSRSMDVYIAKLRKHFIHDSSISISNIHNVGFRLNIKDSEDGKKRSFGT
jgi:DNA-binding response OmpR family regulator